MHSSQGVIVRALHDADADTIEVHGRRCQIAQQNVDEGCTDLGEFVIQEDDTQQHTRDALVEAADMHDRADVTVAYHHCVPGTRSR